jgi:ABC-type glycerol-3-phosphate transport system substrate-binding protein
MSRTSHTSRSRLVLLAAIIATALVAAACGGGDDGPSLPDDFDLATDGLPAASSPPDRVIDTTRLGPFDIAGNVNDGFNRCSLYSPAELTELLAGAWELTVTRDDGAACVWKNAEGADVLEYLRVAVVAARPSEVGGFDPTLGDDASDLNAAVESALEIGDETFEVPTGTYGSGIAFRKGDVAVQIHAIWGVDDFDAQQRVERQIEFRVAENIASRLP